MVIYFVHFQNRLPYSHLSHRLHYRPAPASTSTSYSRATTASASAATRSGSASLSAGHIAVLHRWCVKTPCTTRKSICACCIRFVWGSPYESQYLGQYHRPLGCEPHGVSRDDLAGVACVRESQSLLLPYILYERGRMKIKPPGAE
jgi:hypothetical protein